MFKICAPIFEINQSNGKISNYWQFIDTFGVYDHFFSYIPKSNDWRVQFFFYYANWDKILSQDTSIFSSISIQKKKTEDKNIK